MPRSYPEGVVRPALLSPRCPLRLRRRALLAASGTKTASPDLGRGLRNAGELRVSGGAGVQHALRLLAATDGGACQAYPPVYGHLEERWPRRGRIQARYPFPDRRLGGSERGERAA